MKQTFIKSRPVEEEAEEDDEDNSGSGDNGESKLVFVLRSRHEALVGTMGDPLLKCYSGERVQCKGASTITFRGRYSSMYRDGLMGIQLV